MTEQRPPRVFISYSHDTVEHQKRVLGLADRLRAEGIDAEIDQYNASPPEGWPLWCERQIDGADVVLMICTETYHRRVKGDEEQGKGLGVVWEVRIIRQLLYDAGAVSGKFVPVLFSDTSPEQIPTPIKGWTRYVVDTEDGYEELYRRLTGQARVKRPSLGEIRPLPVRKPKSSFEPDTTTVLDSDNEAHITPPSGDEPLVPSLSSKMGSIHVHIDGGEDKQLAKNCARLIDPQWSKSEIAEVVQFVDGPQRNQLKDVYAEHTPTKSEQESLQFFSTTVLHEGDSDPSGCELAEIQDKVRRVLGKLSADLQAIPREPGGIVVEAERVVGHIDANGDVRWATTLSLPAAFGPTFTFRKKNAFTDSILYEIHFAIDLPRKNGLQLPLPLSSLLTASAQAGIPVGGWFIFWNPTKWAYRSNMFLDHLDQNYILSRRERLAEQVKRISGIDPAELRLRVIVEESLGVWRTPFEKVNKNSLTVPELAVWEESLPPSAKFWVVTGNFLGDQNTAVKRAMIRNLAAGISYVYFLKSFADLVRWQRFRQELKNDYRDCVSNMDAFVIEFDDPAIWSEDLDCFIARSGGKLEGYKLTRDPYNNNVIMGYLMSQNKIDKIVSLLEPLMKERSILSTLHVTEEMFVDGAVIWLDFGYFDIINKKKPNESNFDTFLDEYDREVSDKISKCGGEVMRSSEMGFVIILARSAYERDSDIVGRTFMLARAMLDLLEMKLHNTDIDSPSHRLVLGYGTMRRLVRSSGRAITGDILRECRLTAADLGPGRAIALSRVHDILTQVDSPWLSSLSPIDDYGFSIDWSTTDSDGVG